MDAAQEHRLRDARHSAGDAINGEVPDAIGEIANMIAGTFRNRAGGGRTDVGHRRPNRHRRLGLLDDVYQRGSPGALPLRDERPQPISVELILTGEDAGGTNAS